MACLSRRRWRGDNLASDAGNSNRRGQAGGRTLEQHRNNTADLRWRISSESSGEEAWEDEGELSDYFSTRIGIDKKAQSELAASVQDLRQHLRDLAVTMQQAVDQLRPIADDRYALIGVEPSVDPDELRRAYHTQVALWHPDKLQSMAPDLQQMASAHLAKQNQAYASLSEELAARQNVILENAAVDISLEVKVSPIAG